MTTDTSLFTGKLLKETEKAYNIEIEVAWGATPHRKAFWFPKSQCSINKAEEDKFGEMVFEVKCWFINKLESDNAFKGYTMTINSRF